MELAGGYVQSCKIIDNAIPARISGVNYFGPWTHGMRDRQVGFSLREAENQQHLTRAAPPLDQKCLLVQWNRPALRHAEMRQGGGLPADSKQFPIERVQKALRRALQVQWREPRPQKRGLILGIGYLSPAAERGEFFFPAASHCF